MRWMPRGAIRALRAESKLVLRLLRVALQPPYEVFDLNFVRNTEPVAVDGVRFTPLGFELGAARSSTGNGVDTMTLALDDVGGRMSRWVGGRRVAGVRVRVLEYFPGVTVRMKHCFPLFDGLISDPQFSDGTVAFEMRGMYESYAKTLPVRNYGPNCSWTLYHDGCNVDQAQHQVEFSAGGGSTDTLVVSPSALGQSANHWVPGYVTMLDGPYEGEVRPIQSSGQGTMRLAFPYFESVVGRRMRAVRLCAKTKAACKGFGNLPNYGGVSETPYIPRVDAASVTISSGGAKK